MDKIEIEVIEIVCENTDCEVKYQGHAGSNVCVLCGERTRILAQETNSRQGKQFVHSYLIDVK